MQSTLHMVDLGKQTVLGASAWPSPAAAIEDVTVAIAGREILNGASLDLYPASVFLLLGENGAGKTTLMRTLCGRTEPQRGRVLIDGRDPRTDVAARSAIGFVPQSVALYPNLTVRENLATFAAYGGRRRKTSRPLDEILRDIRLDAVAERSVGELSGGYQRRANLGAALVTAPSVLLLDEPTVGLDAAAKSVLVEVIREVARSGVAILITTHDLDVGEAVADRVGFLAGGRIAEQGALPDLLARMFGRRFGLTFVPGRPPDSETTAAFTAAGLHVSSSDGAWRSPREGSAEDVIRMVTGVAAPDRLGTRRLEIVEPGLRDLYDLFIHQGTGRD